MKQRYVLLLGLAPFLVAAILAILGVELMTFVLILIPTWTICLGYAFKKEKQNVEQGEVDLSKQSTGNKIFTYTLTIIFFGSFIGLAFAPR